MEIETEVKTYLVRYVCDESGCPGELLPTGTVFDSWPPRYPHMCNGCDKTQTFSCQYPRQKLVEFEEE